MAIVVWTQKVLTTFFITDRRHFARIHYYLIMYIKGLMAGLWTAFMYRDKKTLFDLTGLFILFYVTPCFILSAMWKYD